MEKMIRERDQLNEDDLEEKKEKIMEIIESTKTNYEFFKNIHEQWSKSISFWNWKHRAYRFFYFQFLTWLCHFRKTL